MSHDNRHARRAACARALASAALAAAFLAAAPAMALAGDGSAAAPVGWTPDEMVQADTSLVDSLVSSFTGQALGGIVNKVSGALIGIGIVLFVIRVIVTAIDRAMFGTHPSRLRKAQGQELLANRVQGQAALHRGQREGQEAREHGEGHKGHAGHGPMMVDSSPLTKIPIIAAYPPKLKGYGDDDGGGAPAGWRGYGWADIWREFAVNLAMATGAWLGVDIVVALVLYAYSLAGSALS